MTVIVAAKTKRDGVVIAGDTRVTYGYTHHDSAKKVWAVKDRRLLLGGCGAVRPLQVAQHWTTWPRFRPDEHGSEEHWLVTELVPALRNSLSGQGALDTSNGVISWGAMMICAHEDFVSVIGSDFSAVKIESGRVAIGSGEAEAHGFLGDHGNWTKADVIEAVRRSMITAYGVGGDVHWASTKTLEVGVAA